VASALSEDGAFDASSVTRRTFRSGPNERPKVTGASGARPAANSSMSAAVGSLIARSIRRTLSRSWSSGAFATS
jgi:hypothetical protein